LNSTPGKDVYGEKRISVDSPALGKQSFAQQLPSSDSLGSLYYFQDLMEPLRSLNIAYGIHFDPNLPLLFLVVLIIFTSNLEPKSYIWVLLQVNNSLDFHQYYDW
jgi:hypothetical protein